MGLINDIIRSVSGTLPAPTRSSMPAPSVMRRVEALSAELGWGIDERVGENGILLHFKDALIGIRRILVSTSPGGEIAVFNAFSEADLPPHRLPPDLASYLLIRNRDAMFVSWRMRETDGGNAAFDVRYTALVGGLDARYFRLICETLCQEGHALDAKFRQAGLL